MSIPRNILYFEDLSRSDSLIPHIEGVTERRNRIPAIAEVPATAVGRVNQTPSFLTIDFNKAKSPEPKPPKQVRVSMRTQATVSLSAQIPHRVGWVAPLTPTFLEFGISCDYASHSTVCSLSEWASFWDHISDVSNKFDTKRKFFDGYCSPSNKSLRKVRAKITWIYLLISQSRVTPLLSFGGRDCFLAWHMETQSWYPGISLIL